MRRTDPRAQRSTDGWSGCGVRRSLLGFVAAPLAYADVVGLDDGADPLMWPLGVAVLAVLGLVVGLRFRDPSGPTPS